MLKYILMNFESSADARDERIFEMTGVRPDPRYFMPLDETVGLIKSVQSGDPEAMQALAASKLAWVYDKFAQKPEVAARLDYEMEDLLQLGALATIEGAYKVKLDSPTSPDLQLRNNIVRVMHRTMMQGKLAPSVNPTNGVKVYEAQGGEEYKLADTAECVGEPKLSELIESDRTAEPSTIEIREVNLPSLLKVLNAKELATIKRLFGLESEEKSLREVGRELGISGERVRQIKEVALNKMEVFAWGTDTPIKERMRLERAKKIRAWLKSFTEDESATIDK